MNSFKFSVLTPSGTSFNDLVEKVVVTTSSGEITILKNHISLIATTKKGRLIIYKKEKILPYEAYEGVLKIGKEETILMCDKIENL